MPKNSQKIGKERKDKYYYLAKEFGFRSRAAFKLIQLNKKYNFLGRAQNVVDLCAAPGGWCQVVKKYQPITGTCVGVDLATIKNIPNCVTLVGDITTTKCFNDVKSSLNNMKADVVLHDGSPNVGANWFKDAYTQSELVVYSARIASKLLRPGGMLVSKVFRSRDYTSLVWLFNQLFNKVEATKPKASRHTSAEIYLVGIDYKAPKSIDEKLFDPNYVFEDIKEKKTLRNLKPSQLMKRRNRNREGYDDDAWVLFKKCPVAEFIDSDHPISYLGEYNEFQFDEMSKIYLNHPETSKEIKILCSDLKVLGMVDFKLLLKWRVQMRKYKDEDLNKDNVNDAEDEDDIKMRDEQNKTHKNPNKEEYRYLNKHQSYEDIYEKDEEELKKELQTLRERARKVKKNLIKKARAKQSKRPLSSLHLVEKSKDMIDDIPKDSLFNLQDSKLLSNEESNKIYDNFVLEKQFKKKQDEEIKKLEKNQKITPEEYESFTEENLDYLYLSYLERRGEKYKKNLDDLNDEKEDENDQLSQAINNEQLQYLKSKNKLLVDLDEGLNSDKKKQLNSQSWFSQNVFDLLREKKDTKNNEDEEEKHVSKKRRTNLGIKKIIGINDEESDNDEEESDDEDILEEDSDDDEAFIQNLKMVKQQNKNSLDLKTTGKDTIKMVPKDLQDEETRAETLAIAKKLLEKKNRQKFIDNSYNRYSFNDRDQAPKWFVDDEIKSSITNLPVTKEEVEKEKQRFKEIDVRPITKVLEAKFRKRRREKNKLFVMRQKANEVAESNELSNQEKAKELSKIYKQAKITTRRRKVFVVGKKGKVVGGASGVKGSVVKLVDKRMKADRIRGKKRKR